MILRGLIEKELRQHALPFSILLLLFLAALGLITGNVQLSRFTGSGLQAYGFLLYTLMPLACLTLGQVLIASEFRQRTQLFLEGLPFPRWRFLAVKYLLGLSFTLLLAGTALGAVLWKSWQDDGITWDFALLLALKSVGWITFLHALFFAHAFLGRYRWFSAGLLFVGLLNLASFGMRLDEFPPLQLIDVRFAYDRYGDVWPDLSWTLGLAAAFAVGGFALGLARDATVASLLAESMSTREKSVAAVATMAALFGTGTVIEKRQEISAVHLPGAILMERSRANVSVSAAVDRPSAKEVDVMTALAPRVADRLQAVAEYLGIERMPNVFLVHRRDFAGARLEKGGLERGQGLLLRANLLAPEMSEDVLQRGVLSAVLLIHTEQRIGLERNAWLLDGFPRWWQNRNDKSASLASSLQKVASNQNRAPLAPQSLRWWFAVRKAAGAEVAEHLAALGLETIETMAGEDPTRRFLSSVLGPASTSDARTWLREMMAPWPRILHRETGITTDALIREWNLRASAVPPS